MSTHVVPMKKRGSSTKLQPWRYLAAGIALMAIVAIAVGSFFWLVEDPDVTRVKQLGEQLFSSTTEMSQADRERLWGELREAQAKLTPRQAEQLQQEVGNVFRNRMMRQIDRYFELPENERLAYLDRQIERMEQGRRQWEQRAGNRNAAGRGGPPGGAPGAGGNRGNDRPRGDRGDSELSRRRRMLDNTTPEERAKFTAYMSALNSRREQLGLPPMGPRMHARGGRR